MTKTATKTVKPKKVIARGTKRPRSLKITPVHRPGAISNSAAEKHGSAARNPAIVEVPKAIGAEQRTTKKALLTDLLRREGGAAIAEMTELLGWLPHSVRAAMTGLRRDGCQILRENGEDGLARYRIPGGA